MRSRIIFPQIKINTHMSVPSYLNEDSIANIVVMADATKRYRGVQGNCWENVTIVLVCWFTGLLDCSRELVSTLYKVYNVMCSTSASRSTVNLL